MFTLTILFKKTINRIVHTVKLYFIILFYFMQIIFLTKIFKPSIRI